MEGFFHLNHDLLNLLFNKYLVYNDYVNFLLVCKDLKRFLESKKRQIYGNGEEIVALRYWRSCNNNRKIKITLLPLFFSFLKSSSPLKFVFVFLYLFQSNMVKIVSLFDLDQH